ncbi:unnamed protein product [Blepharisma stoltei]|uniref:Uncharacterized protein n=1 Tax=Blepharisma stoltei TaxID=1481888 RepID=A0AAU9IJ36_9CILI|nr:unnamed protein product [Blepharisma stoltei]
MNADSFFIYTSTLDGTPMWIISNWYPHPCTYNPTLPLCKLYISINGALFYTPSHIFTNSCNSQLISTDYFTILRSAFKETSHKCRFFFREDKEENSAEIELHMPMDEAAKLFVSMFKARLEKSFKGDGMQDFLVQAMEVVRFKNEVIDRQNKRVADLTELSVEIDTTRVEVARMREETGLELAAQFLGILNDLKSKEGERSIVVKEEEELNDSLLADLNENSKKRRV